jgi:hypothetical protein
MRRPTTFSSATTQALRPAPHNASTARAGPTESAFANGECP